MNVSKSNKIKLIILLVTIFLNGEWFLAYLVYHQIPPVFGKMLWQVIFKIFISIEVL